MSGPRFSESNDVESWIEGIMTKWEKEHGPIPKNEVMFHEISEAGSALPNKTGMYKKTKG